MQLRTAADISDAGSEPGRALLREQYRSPRDQIPVMYLILCANSTSLSLATVGTVDPVVSVTVPALLSVAAVAR